MINLRKSFGTVLVIRRKNDSEDVDSKIPKKLQDGRRVECISAPRAAYSPSAAALLNYVKEPGKLPVAVFSSEYDALNEIVIETEIIGNEGLVKRVWFREAA